MLRLKPTPALDPQIYEELVSAARRFARVEADAYDLVHDALEVALSRGVSDWTVAERQAWLRGVIRRHAAFIARTRARRKTRELAAGAPTAPVTGAWVWEPGFLASLPRSLRLLATLVSADLCAAEVRWLLGLTDTALRQRLSALRRALRGHQDLPTLPAPGPPAAFGARRKQVLAHLQQRGGRAIATQDPDGHVLFLRMEAHKPTAPGNG